MCIAYTLRFCTGGFEIETIPGSEAIAKYTTRGYIQQRVYIANWLPSCDELVASPGELGARGGQKLVTLCVWIVYWLV